MKKAAHMGRQPALGHFVSKSHLYKSVRVVEIVIVEDVLVLVCERLGWHGHFVHNNLSTNTKNVVFIVL